MFPAGIASSLVCAFEPSGCKDLLLADLNVCLMDLIDLRLTDLLHGDVCAVITMRQFHCMGDLHPECTHT